MESGIVRAIRAVTEAAGDNVYQEAFVESSDNSEQWEWLFLHRRRQMFSFKYSTDDGVKLF